ncbi:apolipo protein O-domain-containing protein [Chytriomyces sp. MP71]|nr:apolipo protein O-domain-containing protein [Chytriomyces sp. MP71]
MVSDTTPAASDAFVPARKRLSIYSDGAGAAALVPPPTATTVERGLRTARHSVSDHFAATRTTIQGYTDSYFAFEDSVRARVKPFYTPTEPLLPNALYVTIAAFAGSIATVNSKRALLRVGGPVGLGVAAIAWWYPQTSQKLVGAGTAAVGFDTKIVTDSLDGVSKSVSGAYGSVQGSVSGAVKSAREAIDSVVGGNRK